MSNISSLAVFWCWVAFIVYWLISARKVKRTAERQSWSAEAAYRLPLTAGGLLLWLPTTRHWMRLLLTPQTDLVRASGVVFCVAGLLLAIWARRILADNWSSAVTFKQGHELIRTGPYQYARHPIYTGLLMMCFGTALDSGQLHGWLGFVFLCVGHWIKLTQEETLMRRHFPDAYPAYRMRVKALIPFVL